MTRSEKHLRYPMSDSHFQCLGKGAINYAFWLVHTNFAANAVDESLCFPDFVHLQEPKRRSSLRSDWNENVIKASDAGRRPTVQRVWRKVCRVSPCKVRRPRQRSKNLDIPDFEKGMQKSRSCSLANGVQRVCASIFEWRWHKRHMET